MRTFLASLLFTNLFHSLTAVTVVRLGSLDFPLSDVIDLKELMDNSIFERPRFTYMGTSLFCNNSALPPIFKPMCYKADAPQMFYVLRQIALNPYPCTICAYLACVGCV